MASPKACWRLYYLDIQIAEVNGSHIERRCGGTHFRSVLHLRGPLPRTQRLAKRRVEEVRRVLYQKVERHVNVAQDMRAFAMLQPQHGPSSP